MIIVLYFLFHFLISDRNRIIKSITLGKKENIDFWLISRNNNTAVNNIH